MNSLWGYLSSKSFNETNISSSILRNKINNTLDRLINDDISDQIDNDDLPEEIIIEKTYEHDDLPEEIIIEKTYDHHKNINENSTYINEENDNSGKIIVKRSDPVDDVKKLTITKSLKNKEDDDLYYGIAYVIVMILLSMLSSSKNKSKTVKNQKMNGYRAVTTIAVISIISLLIIIILLFIYFFYKDEEDKVSNKNLEKRGSLSDHVLQNKNDIIDLYKQKYHISRYNTNMKQLESNNDEIKYITNIYSFGYNLEAPEMAYSYASSSINGPNHSKSLYSRINRAYSEADRFSTDIFSTDVDQKIPRKCYKNMGNSNNANMVDCETDPELYNIDEKISTNTDYIGDIFIEFPVISCNNRRKIMHNNMIPFDPIEFVQPDYPIYRTIIKTPNIFDIMDNSQQNGQYMSEMFGRIRKVSYSNSEDLRFRKVDPVSKTTSRPFNNNMIIYRNDM